jgi:hypothetical protein
VSLTSVFDEAKDKLEEFLGGEVLNNVKGVVDDLKAKLEAAELVVEGDVTELEAQAAKVKEAVEAQAKAELAKLEADEPEILAAVKAAVEAIVTAAEDAHA